jgi:hypothetical protein
VKEPCSYVWTVVNSILSKPFLKLRELQLKGIPPGTNYPTPLGAHHPMNLNLETIACLFPHLNHLGLSYTLVENNLPTGVEHQLLQGSTVLERVQFLEPGCPELEDHLLLLMSGALKRCPNLRKLRVSLEEDSTFKCEFMTSFVKLVHEFPHVDIKFKHLDIKSGKAS